MGRTPSGNVQGLKKGAWTAEEDEKLIAYIQKHGEGSWRSLPENAGLQRCGKSCRLRWANYLRPGIKRGEFTLEEEETIIKLHAALGNRWAAIARYLPRRTDNEIKNHWNAHLKKRLAKMGIDNSAKGSPTASSSSQMQHHQGSSSASTTAKLLNKLATNLTILQRIGTNLSSQSMSVTTASTNTMSSFSGSVSAPSGPAVSDSAWVGRDMSSVFTTQLDFPEVSNSIFSESVEGNNAGDDIVSTLSNVSTPAGYAVMNRMDAKFSSLNCKEDQLQDCKTSIIQEPLMEGGTSTSKTAPIVEYVDGFSDDIDIGGIWDDCSHEADMVFPFSDEDFNFVENAILPKDDDIP